jgi:hypothetical protein
MENGSPTSKILPMSTVTVYPESVEISENASIPTTFKFPAPVYLTDTQEYCFAILSDSNEYTIWISEMGQVDITGDRTISAQPYAGVLSPVIEQSQHNHMLVFYSNLKMLPHGHQINCRISSLMYTELTSIPLAVS